MPLKALHPHMLVRKYQKPRKQTALLLTNTKLHYTLTICEVVDTDNPHQEQLAPGKQVVVDSSALKYSIEEDGVEHFFIHVDAIFGHYTLSSEEDV
jgi:hypothetical protein